MKVKVRLKQFEIDAIRDAFAQYFLPTDHIWVFGSRADLEKRGGDIDLYIETTLDVTELSRIKLDFILAVGDKIGDQKIDVVINTINASLNLAIYQKAREQGVQLA